MCACALIDYEEKMKLETFALFFFLFCDGYVPGIVLSQSFFDEESGYRIASISKKSVDIKGFEPLTFSMQSRRSTTDLNALSSTRKNDI